ncbi:MAG: hypothetical protein HC927_05095 [Deltaproteobacteria bacterium]|nr:hypothetical protein [Deltaproteobacteria bacterium]
MLKTKRAGDEQLHGDKSLGFDIERISRSGTRDGKPVVAVDLAPPK